MLSTQIQLQAKSPQHSPTPSHIVSMIPPIQKFSTFLCTTKIQGTVRGSGRTSVIILISRFDFILQSAGKKKVFLPLLNSPCLSFSKLEEESSLVKDSYMTKTQSQPAPMDLQLSREIVKAQQYFSSYRRQGRTFQQQHEREQVTIFSNEYPVFQMGCNSFHVQQQQQM